MCENTFLTMYGSCLWAVVLFRAFYKIYKKYWLNKKRTIARLRIRAENPKYEFLGIMTN